MANEAGGVDWPHLFIPGSKRIIITLHGFGGNESEVSQLGGWLDPDATIFSPRGGKILDGAHYWYGELTPEGFRPDDIHDRATQLRSLIQAAAEHYGFNPHDALIAGFSNGAAMALALATLYPEFITQVAAFSGVYPFPELPTADLSGTKIWYSHGDADPWVPTHASEHAQSSLQALLADTTVLIRPGGHTISGEEITGAQSIFFS
jgi:phospholipase/carboxylesterase